MIIILRLTWNSPDFCRNKIEYQIVAAVIEMSRNSKNAKFQIYLFIEIKSKNEYL